MAFKKENLTPFANHGKRGKVPLLWCFYNQDGDVVTADGYFPINPEISKGDQVLVVNSDYSSNAWYNAKVADQVITLVANT